MINTCKKLHIKVTCDTGTFLHRRSKHYFTIQCPLRIIMYIIKRKCLVFIENIDVSRTGASNFY